MAAGPEGRLRFVPETVEITVGQTVRWTFESAGHNVTSLPGASEKVRNPDGAEPFASYEGNQHFAIDEVGSTYEHTFDVPGEYVYVCAPHAGQGMVGTVLVTEDDEE
ncbi:cupredoxin domain-containing protein [Haloarchaeobius litoreus]|uniref:Plastocyanin/azurin family copper-binding protein n=1 Tax=Haloarchaeobius litoreus TaxID=755306 RepID=A0ABD6DNU2_9EURY